MEPIVRDISELTISDRSALERIIGRKLAANQRINISVVDSPETAAKVASGVGLPPWCNVFAGLSDAEIAAIEKSIVREEVGSFRPLMLD